MLTEFSNDIDPLQAEPRLTPRYRVVLYSRWIDTDSAILTGTHVQQEIDITNCVISGTLNLAAGADASSLSLSISLEDQQTGKYLTPDLFSNCVVQLFEGFAPLPSESWVPTFTGFHIGQPRSSEANTQDARTTSTSVGKRGAARRVEITFTSRGSVYRDRRISTPGVWIPIGANKNPDQTFAYRDSYDDIGRIAREVATESWGMGLDAAEVLIGKLPYRIEKQLQIVDTSVLEALTTLLQPLHLKPIFDGRGRLKTYSEDASKTPVREYARAQVTEMPQPASGSAPTNAVRLVGLDSELTEVVYADQRLLEIHGTFGFFDSELIFKGTWGADDNESFRIKLGVVPDGNGVTRSSPRIVDFEQEGFIIEPVYPPVFDTLTEYRYVIAVRNDVFLVAAAIAALIGGYTALVILTTTAPEISGGVIDTPNPAAISAELLSSALLVAGLTVLQQIGNFRFEVWGVPFETVYAELPGEHLVSNFAAFDSITGFSLRDYERKQEEWENHIFSSIADRSTDDGVVNIGVQRWLSEQLAFEVAKSARRQLQTVIDILLEPGDAVQFDNQVLFVETISRTLERGAVTSQTIQGNQLRRSS